MKVNLTATGQSALVVHNERLADPLDSIVRAIGNLSKKRGKTIADHQEIARLEFYGGLYTSEDIEFGTNDVVVPKGVKVGLPAWNIIRCLQDGAKKQKKGKDVLKGIHPLTDFVELSYAHGITDPVAMWTSQKYSLRKTVGIQRSRTMRTRPIFEDWSFKMEIEVDPEMFDLDTLQAAWDDAGRYSGIGEMRPVYGRFEGKAVQA